MNCTEVVNINTEHFNPFHATHDELIAQSLHDSGLLNKSTTLNGTPAAQLLESFFAKRNMYKNATRLGVVIIESGKIPPGKLQEALDLQKENKSMKIGEILVSLGVCTAEEIDEFLQIQRKKRAKK